MKNEFGKEILCINDTEYEIGPCQTCKAIATEAEALVAKAGWIECHPGRTDCVACGKPIEFQELLLLHDHKADVEHATWQVLGVAFEPALFFTAFEQRVQGIHRTCAKRTLPFAVWDPEKPSNLDKIRSLFPDVYPPQGS